jgi:hypothetical protein
MKNMMKFLMIAVFVLFLANMLALAVSAATLDDVAKGVQQLQIGQVKLEERLSSEIKRIDDKANILIML